MSEIKPDRRNHLLQRVRRECYDTTGSVMSPSLVLDLLMDVDAQARVDERERICKILDKSRGTVIVGLRTLTMQQLASRVHGGVEPECAAQPVSPAAYDDLLATDTD